MNVSMNAGREVRTQFAQVASADRPFRCAGGDVLDEVVLAYESWGTLSEARDNVVLLFHALTGSHHAAGFNPAIEGVGALWSEDQQEGWWSDFIGPGLALDTDRYFVLCVNYLGGCYGSTGPPSRRPATEAAWSVDFPGITMADIVRSQMLLLDQLGIERLHAVVGASTGGMAAINCATLFAERVERVVLIATGLRATALHLIHNYEQIRAIEADPKFRGGRYAPGEDPIEGLTLARMICHKTFVSLRALESRSLQDVRRPDDVLETWYGVRNRLESYMLHQGRKFAKRFDANSYVRILDAWNRFEPVADAGVGSFEELFERCRHQRYLLFSISSDVCYYPEEQEEIANVLRSVSVECMRLTVHSDKGHDSFMLEAPLYAPHIRHLLQEPPG